jgi:transposase InsO family protein
MRLHANARLGPRGRQVMVERVLAGWPARQAAEAAGVSAQTCRKWVARYRREGVAGLHDRPSVAHRIPSRTGPQRVQAICALRRVRFSGPQIAEILAMPRSTVSAVLRREGMGRLGRLGQEPANRYERERPGELVHIDVKKLGRISGGAGHRFTGRQHYTGSRTDAAGVRRARVGWECVHVAIDDATRLAYAEVLADETALTAIGFLERAIAFYARHGIVVQRLMTDNGAPYVSAAHALACRGLGIRHLRTRPRRPQTNGKAERFIRTMLTEWAYGAIYGSSAERTAALGGWLIRYNQHRPHGALGHRPPAARLAELRNNAPGPYT